MASLFRRCPRCSEPLSIDLITESWVYYVCLRCDGAWRLPPSRRWLRLRTIEAVQMAAEQITGVTANT